jgi:hypothetical protein
VTAFFSRVSILPADFTEGKEDSDMQRQIWTQSANLDNKGKLRLYQQIQTFEGKFRLDQQIQTCEGKFRLHQQIQICMRKFRYWH